MQRNILKIIGLSISIFLTTFAIFRVADAIAILPVQQGGTGWGYPGGILHGSLLFGNYGLSTLATSSDLSFATSTRTLSTFNLTVNGTCTGCGGGGSQTPWLQTIDGGGFSLNDAGTVKGTSLVATSTSASSTISTGGFTVGTTQFVVQQTSGNVGIGTSSPPNVALTVEGSPSGAEEVRIQNDANSAGNDALLSFFNPGRSTVGMQLFLQRSPYVGILNMPVGDVFELQSGSGKVGVGTSTPGSKVSITSGLSVGVDYGVTAPTNGAIIEGNIGIGTTTPGSLLSLGSIANFTTGTSSFYGNGINLTNGCFSINNICVGTGGGSGTVTQINTTDGSLTGGPITTTGSLSINPAHSNWWTALQNFTNASTSQFTATSSVWFTGLTGGAGGLGIDSLGKIYSGATTTAGTGLTYTAGAFNVNSSQSIATLSNLGTNGFVRTSGSNGTLGVQTDPCTYAEGCTGTTTGVSGQLAYYGSTAYQAVATSAIATNGTSITNSGSLGATIGGTTAIISLNLGNANTWTALQQFSANASTSKLSVIGPLFIGDTATATIKGSSTSTFTNGLSLSGGGLTIGTITSCNSGSQALITDSSGDITCGAITGASGITDIGTGYATTTGPKVTFSTTTSTTNGLTSALTITQSGTALSFKPSQSGTLAIAGGGTNQTSQTTNGLNYFDGLHITSDTGLTYGGSGGTVNLNGTAPNLNLTYSGTSQFQGSQLEFVGPAALGGTAQAVFALQNNSVIGSTGTSSLVLNQQNAAGSFLATLMKFDLSASTTQLFQNGASSFEIQPGETDIQQNGYPQVYFGAHDATPIANVEEYSLNQGNYSSFGLVNNNGGGRFTGDLVLDNQDTIAGIGHYLALVNNTGAATCLQITDGGVSCLSDYNGLSSLFNVISPAYNAAGTEAGHTATLQQPLGNDAIDYGLQNYPGTFPTGIDGYQNYYTSTYANPLPTPDFSFWEQANGSNSESSTAWHWLVATTSVTGSQATTTSICVGDVGTTTLNAFTNCGNTAASATFQIFSSSSRTTALDVSKLTNNVSTHLFDVNNNGSVGIGSTTPWHTLGVVGGTDLNGQTRIINNQLDVYPTGLSGSYFFAQDGTGGKVYTGAYSDVANGFEPMYIDGAPLVLNGRAVNNVGIGTTTPGSVLSVGGSGTGINFYDNATSTFSKGLKIATGGLTLSTLTSCSGSSALTTDSSGDVQCGAISGGSGITALGPTGQTQSGATQTLASTTAAFDGVTFGVQIVGSSNTQTFTPTFSGNFNSLNHDSTLTGTAYNASAAVSNWGLDLTHANTWTGQQIFNSANVGIGSTSPFTALGVSGTITANNINATSTTATSLFSGTLSVLTHFISVIAAAFTPSTEGELGIDSTDNQLKFYSNSAVRVLSPDITGGFTYSTTTAWAGTTTLQLGPSFYAETWNKVKCYTDVGTVNVQFKQAANLLNMLNASTTIGTNTFTTNNAFAAGDKRSVDIGTPASAPTYVSCTVSKTRDAT